MRRGGATAFAGDYGRNTAGRHGVGIVGQVSSPFVSVSSETRATLRGCECFAARAEKRPFLYNDHSADPSTMLRLIEFMDASSLLRAHR